MTGRAALPSEDPTPPDGFPTPPAGVPAGSVEPTAPDAGPLDAGPVAASPQAGSDRGPAPRRCGQPDPAPARGTRSRRLQAVPDDAPTAVSGPRTGAFGRPIGKHRPTALHRLVELARVLVGGLMVLTLTVIVAPLVLAASGPGIGVVLGHVAGSAVALAATGVAAWPRTPVWAATGAALVVPVDVLVVLAVFWW